MSRTFGVLSVALLAASSASAESAVETVAPAESAVETVAPAESEMTPAVVDVVALANTIGRKTLLYAELDDQRGDGGSILGMNIISRTPDAVGLQSYEGAEMSALREAISTEALASGPRGWRSILIVVEDGVAAVVRGPRAGAIEGFDARLHAAVNRTFEGAS